MPSHIFIIIFISQAFWEAKDEIEEDKKKTIHPHVMGNISARGAGSQP